MKGNYDDIINLPHHVSPTRPQMSMMDRAAQFSPFAALTGHEEAIAETGRLTDGKIELNEESLNILNTKFQMLIDRLNDKPKVAFSYFQPDERKDGGAFLTVEGIVKKLDGFERLIILQNGAKLQMDNVIDIDGEIFKETVI